MRNPSALERLIPITRLRHFYYLLRDFPSQEFHLATAREFCRPDKRENAAAMVVKSKAHFELYNNADEHFHARGNDGGLNANALLTQRLAYGFLQQVVVMTNVVVDAAPRNSFSYVDYDISPYRTTRSCFENGDSGRSSGTGGIDILLTNSNDRTPIVGEIKADTDVNPFLGLIQSLMYGVELSTKSQRLRLNQAYPERFADFDSQPRIDICLFLLRYPEDAVSQEFLNLTDHFSAWLTSANSPASDFIRRIVALRTMMPGGIVDGFTVAFDHGG